MTQRPAKALARLRKEYASRSLEEKDVGSQPFRHFARWFQQAVDVGLVEPNAMMLATVNKSGKPSLRPVLLKDWSRAGFVFFTNYRSRKGRELRANARVALAFYWGELERVVRIEGRAQKVSRAVSQRYFSSRPRQAQIAAWASAQSVRISDRESLELHVDKFEQEWAGTPVPCPEHWGGFIVVPDYFEFWQGRPSRLHDRIVFRRARIGRWTRERLAP